MSLVPKKEEKNGEVRAAQLVVDGTAYETRLMDLPCIVEAQKTFDSSQYFKAGDIASVTNAAAHGSHIAWAVHFWGWDERACLLKMFVNGSPPPSHVLFSFFVDVCGGRSASQCSECQDTRHGRTSMVAQQWHFAADTRHRAGRLCTEESHACSSPQCAMDEFCLSCAAWEMRFGRERGRIDEGI